jgi:hypothetical protein
MDFLDSKFSYNSSYSLGAMLSLFIISSCVVSFRLIKTFNSSSPSLSSNPVKLNVNSSRYPLSKYCSEYTYLTLAIKLRLAST